MFIKFIGILWLFCAGVLLYCSIGTLAQITKDEDDISKRCGLAVHLAVAISMFLPHYPEFCYFECRDGSKCRNV